MIIQDRNTVREETTPRPDWNNRFKAGDVVRTVGGGGSYNRGQIIEATGKEKYYWVDYG